MKTWSREPIVHFALFGALVLGLQRLGGRRPLAADDPHRIVVDEILERTLDRQLHEALGRTPTADEHTAAVDDWVRTEVLFREARRLELDRTDPRVRNLLAQKMVILARSLEVPPEPSDDDLRVLWNREASIFSRPPRVSFRQIMARDESHALEVERAWRQGADPDALGVASAPGGPILRGRTPDNLARNYGPDFAEGVSEALVGRPTVVQSTSGWHVVQVESRTPGGRIPFPQARSRLRVRWQQDWLDDATRIAVEELLSTYQVEGWP